MRRSPAVLPLLALFACHGGNSNRVEPAVPALLAAGMNRIDPTPSDRISDTVDLQRLGISSVDRVYELTTPAGEPFEFDLLSRSAGNSGYVQISVAHALDDGRVPIGAAESMAAAGFVIQGTGLSAQPPWLDATGDGFARVTIRGAITRDQVLGFRVWNGAGFSSRLVRVAIGPASVINGRHDPRGNHPDVVTQRTLYSSDSWNFGLPTIAVSGDRTSVVAYDGDQLQWGAAQRYEMRLQHESATDTVTGGGSTESSLDTGHWRDHEIAALFNVLALARCGAGDVTVELSFDRGATFGQVERFAAGTWSTRLVQIAMAADYSIAVVFAQTRASGASTDLVLVEGRAVEFDAGNSPTRFEFDAPQVVHTAARDASPLLIGVTWSEAGDLVIGYGFSWFERGVDGTWVSTSEFRCAVRLWNGEFDDQPIDRDVLVGRDPSVAVLDGGADLRIFYAYEGAAGIRLRSSSNAGGTWSAAEVIGEPGAHTPTVFARRVDTATRVDLLYLTTGDFGSELHASRWIDFGSTPRADYRLSTSVMVPSNSASEPLNERLGSMPFGFRITQVAWFGYDAVRDGDELVIVFDQETFDAAFVCFGAPISFLGDRSAAAGIPASPGFSPADPPPLAPGMTLPVPAPDPTHRHQLQLLRLR